MILDEFTRIAKPLIESRGLGENDKFRGFLLQELHFCSVADVDNFGMLTKYEKPLKHENKLFTIEEEWFRKYLCCVSACWIEVFLFSPLESIDSQIAEDIIVGSKFAHSKNKRYLPVIICPDHNAFATRLMQIKANAKVNVLFLEGTDDSNAVAW